MCDKCHKAHDVVSEDTRQKIGLIRRGRKHSPETLAKMSLAQKGRRHTEETKLKISQSQIKRDIIPWNKGKKGLLIAWNKGQKVGSAASLKGWETRRRRQQQE